MAHLACNNMFCTPRWYQYNDLKAVTLLILQIVETQAYFIVFFCYYATFRIQFTVQHMSECSFCGTAEEREIPLCQACGALRYPVEKRPDNTANRQQTLKLSAAVAAAIVTPGAFVVLAVMGISRLNTKIKNRKI